MSFYIDSDDPHGIIKAAISEFLIKKVKQLFLGLCQTDARFTLSQQCH